jgi:hypothetical protein
MLLGIPFFIVIGVYSNWLMLFITTLNMTYEMQKPRSLQHPTLEEYLIFLTISYSIVHLKSIWKFKDYFTFARFKKTAMRNIAFDRKQLIINF